VEHYVYLLKVVSFTQHYKDPIKCVGLFKADIIIISWNGTCSRHHIAEKNALISKYFLMFDSWGSNVCLNVNGAKLFLS
jgi:hypothetical protein